MGEVVLDVNVFGRGCGVLLQSRHSQNICVYIGIPLIVLLDYSSHPTTRSSEHSVRHAEILRHEVSLRIDKEFFVLGTDVSESLSEVGLLYGRDYRVGVHLRQALLG